MNKFESFATAMSEQLFQMRCEYLVNHILFADSDYSKQIPLDFVDSILDEDIHIASIKERIRVEILEQVQQCPTHFKQDDNGDYLYSMEVYDYAYIMDKYIQERYEEPNGVTEPHINLVVDMVLGKLKADFAQGDYTLLEALLQTIPRQTLINTLPEEQHKDFN